MSGRVSGSPTSNAVHSPSEKVYLPCPTCGKTFRFLILGTDGKPHCFNCLDAHPELDARPPRPRRRWY